MSTTAYASVFDENASLFEWYALLVGGSPGITFNLCPEYELPIRYRRRAIRTPAASGFVQRRTLWSEGDLRTFTLGWRTMNSAEAAELRDLWRRTRGPVLAMNYTPPTGGETRVRFKRPQLRLAPRSREAWAAEVELEEVR